MGEFLMKLIRFINQFFYIPIIIVCISIKSSAQIKSAEKVLKVDLQKCIELTLENNNMKKGYLFAEKAANAKLEQAKSK